MKRDSQDNLKKWLRRMILIAIPLVAAIVSIIVEFFHLWDRPKYRNLKHTEHLARIAELVNEEDIDNNSSSIQRIMEQLHKDGDEDIMKKITVPNVTFYMADFEHVDWQGVNMDDVEFACSEQAYDNIDIQEEKGAKIPPCTQLRKADFTGASLRDARFNYADLREADFTTADLSEVKMRKSAVSGAKFLKDVRLRGIEIRNSDFSGAQFSPRAKFRCTVMNKECVLLKRSDFSSAVMDDVLFRGAKVDRVDFTGAQLKEAGFDCERSRNGKQPCTVLENLCVRDAVLTGATFEDITISNADFTGADLADARFTNVKFDQTVLTKEQEKAAAEFDKSSRASLHKARKASLVSEDPREIPCDQAWRRDIKEWMDGFVLAE